MRAELTGFAIRITRTLTLTRCGACARRLRGGLDERFKYFIIAIGELLVPMACNRRAQLLGTTTTPGERAISLIRAGCAQQLPAEGDERAE